MSAKDLISNIVAIILVIVTVVQGYIEAVGDQPINWYILVATVAGAIIAYFTGKNGNLRGSL